MSLMIFFVKVLWSTVKMFVDIIFFIEKNFAILTFKKKNTHTDQRTQNTIFFKGLNTTNIEGEGH